MGDIPFDKAELLSTLLEGILYGFSLLGFGGTFWVLLFRRTTGRVNYKMLVVAGLLLSCSTAHLVIEIIRIMQGLILYRDTYPGGPSAFFAEYSHWTFVSKNYVYAAQTLIGDWVILYRCYVIWQSKLVMILPVLLWSATFVTGIASPFVVSQARQHDIFAGNTRRWIDSFFVTSFVTNLLSTFLLGYRIWHVDHKVANLRGHLLGCPPLRKTLRIIIDAGVIYFLALLVALVTFVCRSTSQFVVVDPMMPIISITFCMIIVRVKLAKPAPEPVDVTSSLRFASTENDFCGDRRSNRVRVRITTLTDDRIDDIHGSLDPVATPTDENCSHLNEVKFDTAAEIV